MRYGIVLTAGNLHEIIALAQEAEAAGCDGVFYWDGVAIQADPVYDPWITLAAIATHMKFRPRSVLGLAPEKRAKYLAQLPTISDAIAARALVNYHLERQRPMMAAFLDLLGIPHEDGLITEENVTKPDAAKVRQAA